MHSYIIVFYSILNFVKKKIFSLQLAFAAGAGFSNIPGKYENVVFTVKNPLIRNNGQFLIHFTCIGRKYLYALLW